MKNKGFTLVELIVVIAVISIIMLIGVPAFAQIVERMKVRSDKASASEIGKALTAREGLVPEEKKLPYYPTLTRYDQIDDIDSYISPDHRPQSIKNGYYFATALNVNNSKKILVGIGKKEMPVTDRVYNSSKESGWAYIESEKIDEFLSTNSSLLNENVTMPENYEIEANKSEENKSENFANLQVGQYVQYTPPAIDSGFARTKNWQIFSIEGNTVALISADSVGSLTLGGSEGYSGAVGVLNNISAMYVDGNYISGSKALGSTPGVSVANITTPLTYEDSVVDLPYEDNTHKTDVSFIAGNKSLQIGKEVWLGSRYIVKNSQGTFFTVRYLDVNNIANGQSLYLAKQDTTTEHLGEKTCGVRPIIYLAPGVKIGNGKGTVESPYKLYKEN